MALDLIAELEAVVDALERAGIDYAVCGGLALGILGHPRMTKDIDLLIAPADLDRAMAAVKAIEFDIPARRMVFRQGKPTEQVTQRLSKLDPDTGALLAVDFLLVTDVSAAVWASRIRVAYRDREMRVVSAEGLVTMKRLAGRPQDLADIAALEQTDDET